jgi:hypothetical protein
LVSDIPDGDRNIEKLFSGVSIHRLDAGQTTVIGNKASGKGLNRIFTTNKKDLFIQFLAQTALKFAKRAYTTSTKILIST